MSKPGRVRRVLLTLVKVVVTVAVVAFIVNRLGWESIVSTVVQARPAWLAGALAVFFASGALGALQWQLLLKNRGIALPFGRAFRLYFMGMFFNNFIFGMVAGDAVRVTYLRLENESGSAGFAATFLDRFAGFWAMSGFAVVGSILLVSRQGMSAEIWPVVAFLLCMFVVFAGVMGFLVWKPFQRLAFGILNAVPVPHRDKVRGLLEGMLLEATDRRVLVPVAVLAVVVQLLRVVVHVLCAASLGLVSWATIHYFFMFVPILAMTMIAPLPFGVREGVEGYLFALAGFKAEAAMVMGFLASLVGIAVSMVGAIFFVTGRKRAGRETE